MGPGSHSLSLACPGRPGLNFTRSFPLRTSYPDVIARPDRATQYSREGSRLSETSRRRCPVKISPVPPPNPDFKVTVTKVLYGRFAPTWVALSDDRHGSPMKLRHHVQ